MSLPTIHTVDPIALRYLMTETIFDVEDGMGSMIEGAAVEPMDVSVDHKPTPGLQFPYSGQNRRNYLFLTDEKQHEWMSGAAMDAFVKTLGALKLAVDDVAVVNLAKLASSPSVTDLAVFFNPRVVVNLGTSFVWPQQDGVTVFHTHAFDDLLVDTEKKQIFWTTIKRLLI
ncbi:hypothetical protein [Parapedobacter sp. 2B3]|uniref:hypothetical protein n=1 Tax=Parapedobacter sp. 2B3 TaxID=3342381 RepID=UPI0035B6514D